MGEARPRVGIVFGAGGVLGGAWMAGVALAIAERTNWAPRHADHLVGTSAGAVLAALGAAGVPPWLLIPESAPNIYHADIGADGTMEIHSDLWKRIVRRSRDGFPGFAPGSLSMTLAGIRAGQTNLFKALCGLAPAGFMSTEPIKETIRWVAPPGGWVEHPSTWIVACDYQTGERIVFGREDGPEVDLAEAVAASCAIPGYYRPLTIGDRTYIDGGVHSMSNLDLALGMNLDLVIVLSPLSTREKFSGWDPLNHFAAATRHAVARQVDAEVELLRAEGTQVLLLEPIAADLVAIGHNVMDDRRRAKVMATATRTGLEQLKREEFAPLLAMIARPAAKRLRPAPAPAKVPAGVPAKTKTQLRPAV